MVSEALDNPELSQARTIQFILDLLDLMFAELFYGFPQYLQGLVISPKNTLKLRLQSHLSQLPNELQNTSMVILIIFIP